MKSKEEFKKKIENGDLNELLKNVNAPEDVVQIAKSQGYEVSIEDVVNIEMTEEMLESIAGGKTIKNDIMNIYGDYNWQLKGWKNN